MHASEQQREREPEHAHRELCELGAQPRGRRDQRVQAGSPTFTASRVKPRAVLYTHTFKPACHLSFSARGSFQPLVLVGGQCSSHLARMLRTPISVVTYAHTPSCCGVSQQHARAMASPHLPFHLAASATPTPPSPSAPPSQRARSTARVQQHAGFCQSPREGILSRPKAHRPQRQPNSCHQRRRDDDGEAPPATVGGHAQQWQRCSAPILGPPRPFRFRFAHAAA